MDLLRNNITKLTIEGIGEVFIKRPSAATSIRLAQLTGIDDSSTVKGFKTLAEIIYSCWVTEKGEWMLKSTDEALEMDTEGFSALGIAILNSFKPIPDDEVSKNSPTLPSDSPSV